VIKPNEEIGWGKK